jgi:lambda repressor-like predicted transcriptional regulator
MDEIPHPEDIKAALRKRFGSIAAFERQRGLPARSVKDVLRGRSRPKIAIAVADALDVHVNQLFPSTSKSPIGDNSKLGLLTHPLK